MNEVTKVGPCPHRRGKRLSPHPHAPPGKGPQRDAGCPQGKRRDLRVKPSCAHLDLDLALQPAAL